MSASRRLAKLKRNPMINDVNNNVSKERQERQEISKNESNLVSQKTILLWHEQRLNKLDSQFDSFLEENNKELIVSLIDTIEAMQNKMQALSDGYDYLIKNKQKSKDKEKKKLNNELTKKVNSVKLNITEKQ